ncbi:hypothetical protein AB0910_18350 [Streptomyces sp. NPDC047002]|uniref:phthiocerol/phthiodiolone dimycocerosyl transferase family protein n=1 Tax=Streptomyces sp. NPDC047002 TaxID=3155475 RepID=UPI003454347E
MTSERYLEPSEAVLMRSARGVVQRASLRGPLDMRALGRAYEALLAGDAALRGVVRRDARGFLLTADGARRPAIRFAPNPAEYEQALMAPLDPAAALVRLVVGREGDTALVGFVVHHAVADGRAAAALFHLLWAHYTAAVTGAEPPAPASAGLRPAAESLLAGAFNPDEIDEAVRSYRGRERGFPAGPPREPGEPGEPGGIAVRRLLLDRGATRRIAESARAAGTSVHAVLCAALLRASHGTRSQDAAGRSVPMTGWSVVDLRPRVAPPVDALGATNFTSGARCSVRVGPDADVLRVARAVKAQLDADLAARVPQRLALRLGEVVGAAFTAEDPPRFLLTNWGRTPDLPMPEGTDVTDLRGYVPQPLPVPVFVAHTYAGRLSVELVLWRLALPDGAAQALLDRLHAELRSVPVPRGENTY